MQELKSKLFEPQLQKESDSSNLQVHTESTTQDDNITSIRVETNQTEIIQNETAAFEGAIQNENELEQNPQNQNAENVQQLKPFDEKYKALAEDLCQNQNPQEGCPAKSSHRREQDLRYQLHRPMDRSFHR